MDIENKRDPKFYSIISDIKDHDEFQRTKEITHHGMNRYDHSLRVSYYSYRLTKILGLDSYKAARGALLHDFFFEENDSLTPKDKIHTMVEHPKYALENAEKYFSLSDIEKDIIVTHMFPVAPRVPRYMESWIVDLVDDVVSVFEKAFSLRRELSAATSFLLVIVSCYFK